MMIENMASRLVLQGASRPILPTASRSFDAKEYQRDDNSCWCDAKGCVCDCNPRCHYAEVIVGRWKIIQCLQLADEMLHDMNHTDGEQKIRDDHQAETGHYRRSPDLASFDE